MKLRAIAVENFGGFEKAELEFPQGLVSVSGRNMDMAGANSNGSGKSCLFDAIAWGLYGKGLRDDGSAEVVKRGANKASVVIYFEQDGKVYILSRTKRAAGGGTLNFGTELTKPATECAPEDFQKSELTQATMALTQEKIDAVLGMDNRIFRAVATFAEDALRFAAATDKEQKDILERLLGLEVYGAALEKVREELRNQKASVEQIRLDMQRENRAANAEQTRAEELQKELNDWAERVQTNLADLENKAALAQGKLAQIETDKAALNKELQSLEIDLNLPIAYSPEVCEELVKIRDSVSELKANLQVAQGQMIAAVPASTEQRRRYDEAVRAAANARAEKSGREHQAQMVRGQIQIAEGELEKVSGRIGKPCGECGRPMTEAELGSAQESVAAKVLKLMEEGAALEVAVQKAHQASQEAAQAAQQAKTDLDHVQGEIDAANGKRAALGEKCASIQREIDALGARARRLEDEEVSRQRRGMSDKRNLLQKQIDAMSMRAQVIRQDAAAADAEKAAVARDLEVRETRIKEATDRQVKHQDEAKVFAHKLDAASEALEYLEFWQRAFGYGGIRSVLLDGVAEKLTERTNRYLKVLTGGSVWVQFATLSETKGGETRERFEVKVNNNFGAGTYTGNSGGERQRIDICIALALHWLVRTRAAKPLGFAIFDEVFERMDETGCEAVVNLLRQEQADLGTMFVVSHNPGLSARFPQSIEVEKRGGVSRVVKPLKETAPCEESKPKSASPKKARSAKRTPAIDSLTTSAATTPTK